MTLSTAPLALVALLMACQPAIAQDQSPKASPAATTVASPASTPPAQSERQRADTHADARVCLEFPNDLQVIACAEKYRRARSR